MLTDAFVTAVTGTLTVMERDVNSDGWDATPYLWGMFQNHRDRSLDFDALSLPPSVWTRMAAAAGTAVPNWVTVDFIARHLSGDGIAFLHRWLGRAAGREMRSCVGFVYCGEDLDTQRTRDPDVPAATPDGIAVRALIARDIDGRTYQIIRDRATPDRTVTTVDLRPATSAIPASLDRLIAAAQR
ncbi:hypothetical protein AB0J82_36700 [Asanoa sp. NPDC049518]|uniref:hypothetical protein n=1 Tax=unclassified Asanoa TaxID=2685164 RepID=UPI0034428F9D